MLEDRQSMNNGNDQEKKIRREIANSNERRRMQSINAGFQSLRTLLPHHEGEKLSKAAILQQTAEYIYSLEQEKTRLLAQNCQLKRLLNLSQQRLDTLQGTGDTDTAMPEVKRARTVPKTEEILTTGVVTDTNLQLLKERKISLEDNKPASPADPLESTSIHKTNEAVLQITDQVNKENTILLRPSGELPETIVLARENPSDDVITETTEGVRVEVERIPNLSNAAESEEEGNSRSYIVTSTSRQNLDSIVEAIRHLEGDHLFSEEVAAAAGAPHQVSAKADMTSS